MYRLKRLRISVKAMRRVEQRGQYVVRINQDNRHCDHFLKIPLPVLEEKPAIRHVRLRCVVTALAVNGKRLSPAKVLKTLNKIGRAPAFPISGEHFRKGICCSV